MGLFDNIGTVKASMDSNYVRPGHYTFLIENGKMQETRNHEPFVVLEMICCKVYPDTPGYLPPKEDPRQINAHFVGERASHLIKYGGKGKDMFLPNILSMLMGIYSVPQEKITKEVIESSFVGEGKESDLRGLVVELTATNRKTKSGGDFTRISYLRTVPPDEYATLGIVLPQGWNQ